MISLQTVLLITNIPTPYRIPLFNELSRQLRAQRFALKVVFGARGYDRRKWQFDMSECAFDYVVIHSKKIKCSDREKVSFTYAGLGSIIDNLRPSVIITNGFSLATVKLWLRSLRIKTNYIIWSGAVKQKGEAIPWWRIIQRICMIKRASAFIAYGTNARDYLLSSGADPNRIWISINTVDTEYFKEETVKLRKLRATVTRKKRLIYIGELSPRKNVVKVLDVVKALAISRDDFLLDIVGDGEERLRLEKYVIDNNLAKFVIFHGHKQKADMPALLACADCFLFQTDFDIWGLVLVEAMAAGLPCLSSVNAGATYDLIDDGVTGFAVDFAETEKIAKKINWIMDNPEEAHQIGETACKWACEKASLFEAARGFVSAISYVANR